MVEEIVLRQARPSDAIRIAEVFLESRRDAMPYLPEIHSDDETRVFIADTVLGRCDVWVGLDRQGAVVGFMALGNQMVEHLYILAGHRSEGMGSALLSKAKSLSGGHLRLWAFQRNAGARRFYEKRGFRASEFTDGRGNEEGEPDVLYEWLAPAV